MGVLKRSLLAAALAWSAAPSLALAADMPIYEAPTPAPVYGGWYLRGYIGMSNQSFGGLDHVLFDDPGYFEFIDKGGFDSAPIFGGGVGYKFNEWIRADVTGEYRGKASFSALDFYDTDGDLNTTDDQGTNDYTAKKSEMLFLVNGYVDVGTWHGITPYVGAGIGASRNTISDFRDANVTTGGGGYAGDASVWNFAWALHAGVGIQVTDRMTVDLGYSYVDLGDAQTGILYGIDGNCSACQPMHFKDITSHDFKLGIRYLLN
jgi:opacity protein-like surface antigen